MSSLQWRCCRLIRLVVVFQFIDLGWKISSVEDALQGKQIDGTSKKSGKRTDTKRFIITCRGIHFSCLVCFTRNMMTMMDRFFTFTYIFDIYIVFYLPTVCFFIYIFFFIVFYLPAVCYSLFFIFLIHRFLSSDSLFFFFYLSFFFFFSDQLDLWCFLKCIWSLRVSH